MSAFVSAFFGSAISMVLGFISCLGGSWYPLGLTGVFWERGAFGFFVSREDD